MGAHADLVVWLGAKKAIHGTGQFTNSPARVVDSPAVDNARAARKPGGLDWDAGAPQFHLSVSAFANACSAPANAGSVVLLQELLADAHAPQEHGAPIHDLPGALELPLLHLFDVVDGVCGNCGQIPVNKHM